MADPVEVFEIHFVTGDTFFSRDNPFAHRECRGSDLVGRMQFWNSSKHELLQDVAFATGAMNVLQYNPDHVVFVVKHGVT